LAEIGFVDPMFGKNVFQKLFVMGTVDGLVVVY